MDNKRFIVFIAIASGILVVYLLAQRFLFPPDPNAPKGGPAAVVEEKDKKKQGDVKKQVDPKKDDAPKPPGANNGGQPDPVAADEFPDFDTSPKVAQAKPKKRHPQQWISCGSLDPKSPYRYLVIFNTRGGCVESIELNERKGGRFRYRDLEDKTGYLANLALTNVPAGGCRVNVVGHGTPAHAAGLRVGDVIRQVTIKRGNSVIVDKRQVSDVVLFYNAFGKSRPGDKATLVVERAGKTGEPVKSVSLSATLTEHPLELVRPEPVDEFDAAKRDPPSFLLSLGQWQEGKWKDFALGMKTENWQLRKANLASKPQSVEFVIQLDNVRVGPGDTTASLEVVKRFRLVAAPPGAKPDFKSYHLDFDFEIHNKSDQPCTLAYQLDGPTGLPYEGWWYGNKIYSGWSRAGARDVIYKTPGDGHTLLTTINIFNNQLSKEDRPENRFINREETVEQRSVTYVGVDAKYFAAAFIPRRKDGAAEFTINEAAARPVHKGLTKEDSSISQRTNVSFYLRSEPVKIEGKKFHKAEFTAFAGPKQEALLAKYGLEEFISFGWFGIISRALVFVLHVFDSIPGFSYALAIILITVVVRACMIPISLKATKNAAMMQQLQPEMKQIAEKHKNDMEKRSKAQQELFKKHKYNPFGGCLLMFLQLPVFLGLYRAFAVDIEARGQALIPGMPWCSNLSAPDMLFHWQPYLPEFLAATNNQGSWFNLGPYFNLLPVITVFFFVIQQKMFTPPALDDQQKMQQRMMSFMTIFIGWMFFKVASGLCLYFIVSSLWGLIERKWIRKPLTGGKTSDSDKDNAAKSSKTKAGATSNGAERKQKERLRKKKAKGKQK